MDPAETVHEILGGQERLILDKAQELGLSTDARAVRRAQRAKLLILTSRDLSSIRDGGPVLYPSEYRARAEALVEARRLVGGIIIEPTESAPAPASPDALTARGS